MPASAISVDSINKPTDSQTPEQRDVVNAVRDDLTPPSRDTVMQKVIPPGYVDNAGNLVQSRADDYIMGNNHGEQLPHECRSGRWRGHSGG